MIQIEQILVTYDPLSSKEKDKVEAGKIVNLRYDDVKNRESFFAPGFGAIVYLDNGTAYSFAKVKQDLWESLEMIDEFTPGEVKHYEGTFESSLNELLKDVNS